jgi:hypothetical protein
MSNTSSNASTSSACSLSLGQPDEHGRGLLIVASLARAWGRAGDSERGWTVWFEMDAW